MTAPVELPALDGRDPLGFLAALGLLHVITAARGPDVRLAFSADTGCALLHSPLPDISAIAAELRQAVSQTGDGCVLSDAGPGFPLRKASRKTTRATGSGRKRSHARAPGRLPRPPLRPRC